MYYRLPDGEPTSNLRALLPQIISPQYLSDAELVEHGVARCVVSAPTLEWWQQRGGRQIDAATVPHSITWVTEDRPLAEVKAVAWQRIKVERGTRQGGVMSYAFPAGSGHIEMTEKVKADLTAVTAAATGLLVAGQAGNLIWTDYENVTHTLTPSQALALGLAAMSWHASIHATSQQVRGQIEGAASVAAVVAAAVWPEG